MTAVPRTIIAIPTLLGGSVIESCLQSLELQTLRDFEVVVIDNGGSGATPNTDLFTFPLRVLRPVSNLGFGGAVNLAFQSTQAAMIAVLNDDTEVEPEWLEELVREIESDPRVGMCASSIRMHETGRLDSAGLSICLDGSSKQRGGSMPPELFSRSEDVLCPSGCAALYRRELLEDVGMFDGDFFLYCEDTDLGLRAAWAGWQCRYAAKARVRHLYSRTSRPYSLFKARYVERNRLWVALKSFPFPLLVLVPLVSAARYAFQLSQAFTGMSAAAGFIRSGFSVGDAAAVVFRAHIETLRHLPSLLRKRAAIRRRRKIRPRDFIRLILRHRISVRELARA